MVVVVSVPLPPCHSVFPSAAKEKGGRKQRRLRFLLRKREERTSRVILHTTATAVVQHTLTRMV